MLIGPTDGKAFSIVHFTPGGKGLETWRLLKAEYEGHSGARLAALLTGILNPRAAWQKYYADGKDLSESLIFAFVH